MPPATPGRRVGRRNRVKPFSKAWITEGYMRFGQHCARNQIRVLIIASFIMTTLFYPALALWLQHKFPPLKPPSAPSIYSTPYNTPKEHPLSILSTPILDSFFPFPPPLLPELKTKTFWESGDKHDFLIQEHRGSSAPPLGRNLGRDGQVTAAVTVGWTFIDQVLDQTDPSMIHTSEEGTGEAFENALLQLVHDWSDAESAQCATEMAGSDRCFVERGGRRLSEAIGQPPEMYTTMTFYFIPKHSIESPSEAQEWLNGLQTKWKEGMQKLCRGIGSEAFFGRGVPGGDNKSEGRSNWVITLAPSGFAREVADNSTTTNSDTERDRKQSVPPAITSLYIGLVLYLLYLLGRSTKVHSRYGLAFTGVTELVCSSVMSYSLLMLSGASGFGWPSGGSHASKLLASGGEVIEVVLGGATERGVPWYILPFVVLVIGGENMSTLTRAVHGIPVSYSVPDRIGLGLSAVGAKLFITSVTDIAILQIVRMLVNLRPVKEFCTFASVLIFVDWWMLHTFFLTVLSIDCQRLELADLLRQGSQSAKVVGPISNGTDAPQHAISSRIGSDASTSGGGVKSRLRRVWQARRARSFSLLFLIFLLTILFYVNESQRTKELSLPGLYGYAAETWPATSTTAAMASGLAKSPPIVDNLAPATVRIWQSLSPANKPILQLSALPPTTVVLPTSGHSLTPHDLRKLRPAASRLLLPRLKPLFYTFKVIFLPQSLTAFLLYLVLRYLLKDADLLDAQRDRVHSEDSSPSKQTIDTDHQISRRLRAIRSQVVVHVGPGAGSGDVIDIHAVPERSAVICQGADNEVVVHENVGESTNTTKRIFDFPTEDIVASHSDVFRGNVWTALVTTDGKITLLNTTDGQTYPLRAASHNDTAPGPRHPSVPTAVAIFDVSPASDDTDDQIEGDIRPSVLLAHDDGSVHLIRSDGPAAVVIQAKQTQTHTVIHEVHLLGTRAGSYFVAISSPDGTITLWEYGWLAGWLRNSDLSASQQLDPITFIGLGTLPNSTELALLSGTHGGELSIWELASGKRIFGFSNPTGMGAARSIRRIELGSSPESALQCKRCDKPTTSVGTLIWSTTQAVTVSKLNLADASVEQCSCTGLRPSMRPSFSQEGSADDILTTPGRRSPRRDSASFHLPSPTPGLLSAPLPSDSPSPKRPNGGRSPRSSFAGDRPSSAAEDHPSKSWAIIETRSWSIAKGGWELLHDGNVILMIRKQSSLAVQSSNSTWQLLLLDLTEAVLDKRSELVVPLDLSGTESTLDIPSSSNHQHDKASVTSRRQKRLLSLTIAPGNNTHTSPSIRHPRLAFSRISPISALGKNALVFGMGNWLGCVRLPPPIVDDQIPRPVDHGSAFHTAPPPPFPPIKMTPPPRAIDTIDQ